MDRTESLTRGVGPASIELAPGVGIRVLATEETGAIGVTTALARFQPSAILPLHTHPISEVVVVLEGQAEAFVEGRRYRLGVYDAIHFPAEVAHSIVNGSRTTPALLHTSFASEKPTRTFVATPFTVSDRNGTDSTTPETLIRFASAPPYELAPRTAFRDLFAGRFGAKGICGGYSVFEPGAGLPCHFHGYDESITIVSGIAISQVAGKDYEVSNYDTLCIPKGRPHRFLNRSDKPIAMIWVYAGDEPDRTIVEPGLCDGMRR
jgi:quercetin dioxygenase-like cupin family protein